MIKKGVMLHNLAHLNLPILIFLLVVYLKPTINLLLAIPAIIIGSYLPDIDHYNIWKKVKFESRKNFLKYLLTSDRYRKAFLVFHNFLTLLILVVALPIVNIYNIYVGIFLLSFIAHLILDFLTDKLLIKQHGHWKLKSWI